MYGEHETMNIDKENDSDEDDNSQQSKSFIAPKSSINKGKNLVQNDSDTDSNEHSRTNKSCKSKTKGNRTDKNSNWHEISLASTEISSETEGKNQQKRYSGTQKSSLQTDHYRKQDEDEDKSDIDSNDNPRKCAAKSQTDFRNVWQESEHSPDCQCSDDNTKGIKKLKIEVPEKIEAIENVNNNNFKEKTKKLKNEKITDLYFKNCHINYAKDKILKEIPTLKHLSFEKCDGDFYKIFENQIAVEKITIINEDQTFDGFSHEDFNGLMKKLSNVKHIVLKGDGTKSYFDFGDYPFEIEKLETDQISFNCRIKDENQNSESKMDFLKSRNSSFKELKINDLPVDFDGQKVINYIFKEMNLLNFLYGDTVLIKNGRKQNVFEITATANQIYSCIELLKIFPDIKILKIILNEIDINIENFSSVFESEQKFFLNIKEMKVVDSSGCRRLLNMFQDLFKNLTNVEKFILESQDRNINAVLKYCLRDMKELGELHLDSKAPREFNRLTIIKDNTHNLKKLFVDPKSIEYAKQLFAGTNVEIKTFRSMPSNNPETE